MDCDFSPSSPHLLPNGLFSPQNRISFELLALSGLSGFSTFKGGKMLIFQGFANSRIVREFPPFSFKVRIATLTRNQFVGNGTWVRIPPAPPEKPVNMRVCWLFSFLKSRQHIIAHVILGQTLYRYNSIPTISVKSCRKRQTFLHSLCRSDFRGIV